MLRSTINVRHFLLNAHTIHRNPIGPIVICITLIPPSFFFLLSPLVLLHLVGQIDSRLCQLPSISLERIQRLLLLVKFILMSMAHIALMLKLDFERMDTL